MGVFWLFLIRYEKCERIRVSSMKISLEATIIRSISGKYVICFMSIYNLPLKKLENSNLSIGQDCCRKGLVIILSDFQVLRWVVCPFDLDTGKAL